MSQYLLRGLASSTHRAAIERAVTERAGPHRAGLERGGSGIAGAAGGLLGSGAAEFSALLELARSGEVRSELPVRVASGAGVELTQEQADRLARVADQAEAHGAARPVVLMDGELYALDVATRTITGKIDPSTPNVLAGVDALVVAPAKDGKSEGGSGAQFLAGPGAARGPSFLHDPSLLRELDPRFRATSTPEPGTTGELVQRGT